MYVITHNKEIILYGYESTFKRINFMDVMPALLFNVETPEDQCIDT